jgi:hypothetical protein
VYSKPKLKEFSRIPKTAARMAKAAGPEKGAMPIVSAKVVAPAATNLAAPHLGPKKFRIALGTGLQPQTKYMRQVPPLIQEMWTAWSLGRSTFGRFSTTMEKKLSPQL